MTDMQKVRVSLVDADGVTHEVVGWKLPGGRVVRSHPLDSQYWYMELDSEAEVTPIVELPTGLGAVVEVREDSTEPERFVKVGDYWWLGYHREVRSDWLAARPFTVLSEGVK